MKSRIFLSVLSVILMFILVSEISFAGLLYPQREALRRMEWSLSDVEKKLNNGVDKKEAGYLLKTVNSIENRFKKARFPGDNERVKKVAKRIESAKARLEAIAGNNSSENTSSEKISNTNTQLTETAKTIKKGPKANSLANSSGSSKLLYPQREKLRRLEGTMKTVEEKLEKAKRQIESSDLLRAYPDPYVDETLKQMEERIKAGDLPMDNPQVKDLLKRIDAAKKMSAKLKEEAAPKISAFKKGVDIRNYPEFYNDLKRLAMWKKAYGSAVFGAGTPEQIKETIRLRKEADNIAAYVNKRTHEYKPLIVANTKEGHQYVVYQTQFAKHFRKFMAKETQFLNSALSRISSDVSMARKMIARAKKGRNVRFFDGGVKQFLTKAERELMLFEGLAGKDDPEVKKATLMVNQARAEAKEARKVLEKEILASNKPPADLYQGGDRKALLEKIRTQWKKNNPNDEILEIRIPYKEWRRKVGWSWNGADSSWEKYDRQYLQFAVVVKTNDEVATIYPAFINRDNLKGTERIVASHKSTYEIRKVLLKNL